MKNLAILGSLFSVFALMGCGSDTVIGGGGGSGTSSATAYVANGTTVAKMTSGSAMNDTFATLSGVTKAYAMDTGGGSLWILGRTSSGNSKLLKVSTSDGSTQASYDAGFIQDTTSTYAYVRVIYSGDSIYILGQASGANVATIRKYSASTGAVTASVSGTASHRISDMHVGASGVWALDETGFYIQKYSTSLVAQGAAVQVDAATTNTGSRVGEVGGKVAVISTGTNKVYFIDAASPTTPASGTATGRGLSHDLFVVGTSKVYAFSTNGHVIPIVPSTSTKESDFELSIAPTYVVLKGDIAFGYVSNKLYEINVATKTEVRNVVTFGADALAAE